VTHDPIRESDTTSDFLADEHVVAAVLAGDLRLFELIMRRYNQRVYRVVRAITQDDAEAEDVTQQAYLLAYANLAQFAGQAAFATWLTRIAINAALARRQKRVRLAEVELAEEDGMKSLVSPLRSPEEHALSGELRDLLEHAVDRLPERYRVVFMMREVQHLDVAETAACLEISTENVKVRLHRAKAMLRELLYAKAERGAEEAFPFLGARCDRIVAAVLTQLQSIAPVRD